MNAKTNINVGIADYCIKSQISFNLKYFLCVVPTTKMLNHHLYLKFNLMHIINKNFMKKMNATK